MTDILTRFLEQAERQPDRIAVSENGRDTSYGALARNAAVLAGRIAAFGQHPKVFILLDQGTEAYQAILAALIAGGIYVPVNTQSPAAKIAQAYRQFEPNVVVTRQSVRARFEALAIDAPIIDVTSVADGKPIAPRPHHELMYVMFTSGSTGEPKGVMIRRHGMSHFIDWVMAAVRPTPEDRWSQHPNVAFDMSHLDILGCLGSGGTLVPFNTPTDRLMPAKKIERERVTLWYSVPGVIGMMAQAKQLTPESLASLHLMNFAGETLLPELVEAIFAVRPDLEIWNTYGPTEATVTCTELSLSPANFRSFCRASVSIGRAISGMRIELMNGPTADEGEIVILGPQLASGYWRSPGLTKAAFREVETRAGREIGYFTGDWGQRDGENIYFVGRIDSQVKIRGVRIELGEVEAALRRCGFSDAVTVLHDSTLHAFMVTDEPAVDEAAVAAKLAELLLPQAVPSRYHAVRSLPRNANGKVDRGAVRARLATTT